ncbi:unnamed protein product [Ranitomeya imitator]|uniref:Uncharacterized protein n=1 Tax=Ranitomeya imitator TaxID=111125 RepID=A0ABN9LFR4_9NEOB|nr:unnamed protein product [Ranitomeya imitator]
MSTRENAKIVNFSLYLDDNPLAVDAVKIPWSFRLTSNYPPTSMIPRVIDEDQAGSCVCHSQPTVLAKEIVVHSHDNEPGPVLEASPPTEPDFSGAGSVSDPESPQSESKEVDRPLLKTKGFSNRVLDTLADSRSDATNTSYAHIKKIFSFWCSRRSINPEEPSIPQILEFLQDGFDRGLKPSTIRVQVATSYRISRDHRLSEGTFKSPRISKPITQWDLGLVLKQLTKPPFEPLISVELRFLTLKTVFLLAVTSAKTLSELQVMASREPYTVFTQANVNLRLLPSFRPKIPSSENVNQVISLPAYVPEATSSWEEDLSTLDIIRCLKVYLKRSLTFRKDENFLVLHSEKFKGKKASKPCLSRWICVCIKMPTFHLPSLPLPIQLRQYLLTRLRRILYLLTTDVAQLHGQHR